MPTVDAIRRAIPAQCFERSLPKALFFLVLDFGILGSLYLTVSYFEYFGIIGLLLWYWLMGMFGSSLFVVGHDCGHGTFSEYPVINDLVGHLAHAPLLAPYWPWQKSHRQHHQYTSHIDKDMGHPWVTEEEFESRNWIERNFSKIPVSAFFRWNPIYTIAGLPDGSHFWPYSKLFANDRERIQCVVSGIACALCAFVAFRLCDYSVYSFIKYYYVPLLFHGFWLVVITYLQHNSESIEVYEEGYWSFVTGQTQTIDRTFGFGHVAHHFFFTRIPHYHLMEATEAIKAVLEPYKGAYKSQSCYDFILEFLILNLKLEYMIGRGTGILKYASKEKKPSSSG
ncbi:unnamed protein product [Toxocara canis]|uniref:Fatty acid desaturase domain-containing protein n=1 Tax=Toxocara canis TaxID=6265 RepID=A0A3P7EN72_TOXCA|nr:unnamed protein product [Toxocara canis]